MKQLVSLIPSSPIRLTTGESGARSASSASLQTNKAAERYTRDVGTAVAATTCSSLQRSVVSVLHTAMSCCRTGGSRCFKMGLAMSQLVSKPMRLIVKGEPASGWNRVSRNEGQGVIAETSKMTDRRQPRSWADKVSS